MKAGVRGGNSPVSGLELDGLRRHAAQHFARAVQVLVDTPARIAAEPFALLATLIAIFAFTH